MVKTGRKVMTTLAVKKALAKAKSKTRNQQGSMVHIWYDSFNPRTATAQKESMVAVGLGLKTNRYTGRISKMSYNKKNEYCISLLVTLERKDKPRCINVDAGSVYMVKLLEV